MVGRSPFVKTNKYFSVRQYLNADMNEIRMQNIYLAKGWEFLCEGIAGSVSWTWDRFVWGVFKNKIKAKENCVVEERKKW